MKSEKFPKISIILSAYRTREDLLRRAINVIISQTFEDWELIVVNDGADERVKDIVFSYNNQVSVDYGKNKSAKIRYYERQKAHGGQSKACNLGLRNAQGKYVLFHDHDDYLYSRRGTKYSLEEMYSEIKDGDADILIFSYYFNHHHVLRHFNKSEMSYENIYNLLYEFKSWNKLYKTSFLCENNLIFNENLVCSEELVFHLETIFSARNIKFSDKCLYFYNRNDFSLSNSMCNCELYYKDIKFIKYIKEILCKYGVYDKFRIPIIDWVALNCFRDTFNWMLHSGQIIQAKQYFRKYLKLLDLKESDFSLIKPETHDMFYFFF